MTLAFAFKYIRGTRLLENSRHKKYTLLLDNNILKLFCYVTHSFSRLQNLGFLDFLFLYSKNAVVLIFLLHVYDHINIMNLFSITLICVLDFDKSLLFHRHHSVPAVVWKVAILSAPSKWCLRGSLLGRPKNSRFLRFFVRFSRPRVTNFFGIVKLFYCGIFKIIWFRHFLKE